MSFDAATAAPPTPEPSAPPSVSTGEEMTPAEKAYFTSRGQDTSGLFQTPQSTSPPSPEIPAAPQSAPQVGVPPPGAAAETGEELEPGEITIAEDGTARDAKGRFVPKPAYLRAKAERAEARTEAQKYRDALIAAKERLAIYAEASSWEQAAQPRHGAPAEPPKVPEPTEDIFAFADHLKEKVASLEERWAKTEEQTKAEREQAALKDFFTSDVARFKSRNADFETALSHAIKTQDQLLAATGVSDEGARRQQIVDGIGEIIRQAKARGGSPAQALYEVARVMGYNKPAPQPQQQTPPANAAALAEIERIRQGQAASASLRGAGTAGTTGVLTRDQLAAMSDDAYAAARKEYIGRHGSAAWNQLLGRG